MRLIYTIIYYLSLPFILLRLLYRSRHNKAYRKRWCERFCFISVSEKKSIWIHAVSVGETLAAIPLIQKIIGKYSENFTIVVTTTTPTGSLLVTQHLKNQVTHVYAPFDLPAIVARFLKRTRTVFCIIMETELWPNVLHACQRKQIPVMLANGRLSERSFARYQHIRNVTQHMLNAFHTVATQSVQDGKRYVTLGLDSKKLIVAGNIKFDLQIPDKMIAQGKELRASIKKKFVLIAASTHDGEESILLHAFKMLREKTPDLLLILAPRHPSRTEKVLTLCSDFHAQQRSHKNNIESNTDILLVDTIGELILFYAASDIAFVGGSLVSVGGHNMLEPAALGLPIIAGPHVQNFMEISTLLKNAGALLIVSDANELSDAVFALLEATQLREKMGQNGQKVVGENRGALTKHLACVENMLNAP